jgi:hypothetical protein
MFATPYFVFVHVPKTGGNFVRTFAGRHFEILWTSDLPGKSQQHVAYDELPPEYRELPAVSFVRNPWDHYVSQWGWLLKHGKESRAAKAARSGFDEFVRMSTARPRGGYASLFAEITQGTDVRRYERLREELLAFLEENEIPTTPALERDLLTSPRVNPSDRGAYQTYYDDETRELVAGQCREIIETFGYTFE